MPRTPHKPRRLHILHYHAFHTKFITLATAIPPSLRKDSMKRGTIQRSVDRLPLFRLHCHLLPSLSFTRAWYPSKSRPNQQ